MRYLAILRYGPDTPEFEPGTPEFEADLARYERFGEVAGDAVAGGAALDLPRRAVSVRHDGGGSTLVTDGPYAETAEVVGGLYVLEAATLDDALELARQNPAAEDGSVELRPVMEWSDRSGEPGAVPLGADRYLALLWGRETAADIPGTPEWGASLAEHERFGEEAGDAVLGGGALHPASTATTVRVRDGEGLLTDGPYAETAEVLGGGSVYAAATGDEATALARRIPMDPGGVVEVRRILELGS